MSDFERLVTELRRWTRNHDNHVRAAVELLIGHGYWLHNRDFVSASIVSAPDGSYIHWRATREAYDADEFAQSSTSERAVLDFAIALATDRFRFSVMGAVGRSLVSAAVATAVGRGPR